MRVCFLPRFMVFPLPPGGRRAKKRWSAEILAHVAAVAAARGGALAIERLPWERTHHLVFRLPEGVVRGTFRIATVRGTRREAANVLVFNARRDLLGEIRDRLAADGAFSPTGAA